MALSNRTPVSMFPHVEQPGDRFGCSRDVSEATNTLVDSILDTNGRVNFSILFSFFQGDISHIEYYFEQYDRINTILFPFLDYLKSSYFIRNYQIPEGIINVFRTSMCIRKGILSYVAYNNSKVMDLAHTEQDNTVAFHLLLLEGRDFDTHIDRGDDYFMDISALFAHAAARIHSELGIIKTWSQPHLPASLSQELDHFIILSETINKFALICAANLEEMEFSLRLGGIIRSHVGVIVKNLEKVIPKNHDIIQKLQFLSGKIQDNFACGAPINGLSMHEVDKQVAGITRDLDDGLSLQRVANFGGDETERESSVMICEGNKAIAELLGIQQKERIQRGTTQEMLEKKQQHLQTIYRVYNFGTKKNFSTGEEIVHDFISQDITHEHQIEAIYYIVLSDTTLSDQNLVDLINFFYSEQKLSLSENKENHFHSHNFFYEQFLIKIIIQIIRRFRISPERGTFFQNIELIRTLLEQRKISQSVLSYSKVYLSLALYYIECDDKESIEYAKKCFFYYKNLDTQVDKISKNPEDYRDEKLFYEIFGRIGMREIFGEDFHNVATMERGGINLFKKTMEDYQQAAVFSIKEWVEKIIASMNEGEEVYTQERINDLFGKEIAAGIFFNICTTRIVGDCENCSHQDHSDCEIPKAFPEMRTESCPLTSRDRGFSQKSLPLPGGVYIVFTYPTVSGRIFTRIFEQQRKFMEEGFKNLLGINKKNAQLKKVAFSDPETGLPNKNKLKEDLKTLENTGVSPTVLCIEIPDYDRITNTVGGETSWEVRMKKMLDTLRGNNHSDVSLSPVKEVYRINESTFVVVFKDPSGHEKTQTPESFVESLPKIGFLPYIGMVMGEKIGVLEKARLACSKAKRLRGTNGNQHMQFFQEEDQKDLNTLNLNTRILRQALDERYENIRLVPHYQPICDEYGTIIKFEALARIKIEEGGEEKIISPGAFISIADDNGWSPDVTKIMFRQIVEDLKSHPDIHVSVNVNAQDWNNDEIEELLRGLAKQGISERITLEILETVRLHREEDMAKIKKLKGAGFSLAIDDYGTGESHAVRVAKIGSESLKIDGVITTMLKNPETEDMGVKLVEGAVKTARDFGAKTVAEYVENAEVLEILKNAGVKNFQGQYFGMAKPLIEYSSLDKVVPSR